MVQVRVQEQFEPFPYNDECVNLHRHTQRSNNVALLIHGLNGGGATTWRDIPSQLFGDNGDPPFDVALYDYPTLFRRAREQSSGLHFYARQLTEQLIEFIDDYELTFLVGHSLGGILARDVARHYLEHLMSVSSLEENRISGILTIASPVAGSPLAVKAAGWFLPEIEILNSTTSERQLVDQFLGTNTIPHNVGPLPSGRPIILPHFAVTAGADIVVPSYSSTHLTPTPQQHHLLSGHSDVLEGDGVSKYLRTCFEQRRQVLEQQARQLQQTRRSPLSRHGAQLPTWHFRLFSDHTLPQWESVFYRKLRETLEGFQVIDGESTDDAIPLHSLTLLINERLPNWRLMLQRHTTLLQRQAQRTAPPIIGVVVLTETDSLPSSELTGHLSGLFSASFHLRHCVAIDNAKDEIELLLDLSRAREEHRLRPAEGLFSNSSLGGLDDGRRGM